MHRAKFAILIATLVPATGVAIAQFPMPKVPGGGAGKVKIETTSAYSGPRLAAPAGIVLYDFTVDAGDVQLNRGAINQVRMAAANVQHDSERARLAEQSSAALSRLLEKELRAKGRFVTRSEGGGTAPDTLAVKGSFLRIDEGDKLVRAGIGFGAGASAVRVHVELWLHRDASSVMISAFEINATSGKRPGAALSMGLGAAPAVAGAMSGSAAQKEDVEGDLNRLAKQLAKQIEKTMERQGW